MEAIISEVAASQAVDITGLTNAESTAESYVAKFPQQLERSFPKVEHPNIDVLFTGSLARSEARHGSDADFLILVTGLIDQRILTGFVTEMYQLCEQKGLKTPGAQGIFGDFVIAAELQARIGLAGDSNANITRRLGILTESRSVYAPAVRKDVISSIVNRYCIDYSPANRASTDPINVPRFLLNDLVRYWRTMAVDFGAKQWRSAAPDYFLRYAKLITTRKVIFAGTLATLFLISRVTSGCSDAEDRYAKLKQHLTSEFDERPLSRLMKLYHYVADPVKTALGRILREYDAFLRILQEPDTKTLLQDAQSEEPDSKELRKRIEEIGVSIESALEQVFFDDPALSPLTRSYAVF